MSIDLTVTIHEFVEKYISAIKLRLRSHEQIRRHLLRFEQFFTGREIASIRRRDIAEYIEQRQRQMQGVDTSSINVELAVFSASINYAKKRWDLDIANPVSGFFLALSDLTVGIPNPGGLLEA